MNLWHSVLIAVIFETMNRFNVQLMMLHFEIIVLIVMKKAEWPNRTARFFHI